MRYSAANVTDCLPTFDVAIAKFQEFLKRVRYAERILWTMPSDVLLTGQPFMYVRVPIPLENEAQYRRAYEQSMSQNRALLMLAMFELSGSSCCCIWHPIDCSQTPEGIWPPDGNVKMSARSKSEGIQVRAVRNRIWWKFLEWRYRRKQQLKNGFFGG
jgi:hypothetical protein